MPHLSFEYSASIEKAGDPPKLAEALRDAMAATGVFPVGGIRVRGHRAAVVAVAGRPADDAAVGFLDMTLRMGAGRDAATRKRAAEAVYSAAEAHLKPRLGALPFALSLEVREIDPDFSIKRLNTLHDLEEARR